MNPKTLPVFDLRAGYRRAILALAVLAACLPLAARALAGEPGARVHVRWQPSADEATRHALERQFRLDVLERIDRLTWRYDLVDISAENIRALVHHSAVADTHEIDRPNYVIASTALRTSRRERFEYGSAVVAAADIVSTALVLFVVLFTLTALSQTVPTLRTLRRRLTRAAEQVVAAAGLLARAARSVGFLIGRPLAPVGRFVQRGVPEIDAGTAGLFRLVFGVSTLAYFAFPSHRVDASWLSIAFDLEVEGAVHAWVMESLRARPGIVDVITPCVITTGVAFVAGVFTRFSYMLFVGSVLLWAYVVMSVDSTHPHSTLVLMLVALLPARWGDAWSVDSWLGRRRGRAPFDGMVSKRYGYVVWVPVLALGIGFAAAAWAKLTVPPHWTSWILNGSIKYHIISDSRSAPITWGLQLVHYPTLAVLISFGAIAIEALVVTAAFVRNEWYRLTMGLAAAALFAGIGAFMGIVWPGWWIPLLGFLPWQRMSQHFRPTVRIPVVSNSTTPSPQWLNAAQFIVVVGMALQQVVVSAHRLERAPMFSWYDMYARSYSGPVDYNSSIPPAYQVYVTSDNGRIRLPCNPHEEFVRDFEAAVEGASESRTRVWHALAGCGADLSNAKYVTLEGTARTFDWDRLVFTPTHAVTRGPLTAHQDEVTAIAR